MVVLTKIKFIIFSYEFCSLIPLGDKKFNLSIFNFQFNLVPLQRLTPYIGRDNKEQFMKVAGNQRDK